MAIKKPDKLIRYLEEEKRLLIGDLDAEVVRYMVQYYSSRGYKVKSVTEKADLLPTIREFKPQVILISQKIGFDILKDINTAGELSSILVFHFGEDSEYIQDISEVWIADGIFDLGRRDGPHIPGMLQDLDHAFDAYVSRFRSRYISGLVFVLMPFSEDYNDIYSSGIKRAVEDCGLVCERVDEQHFTGPILEKILDNIRKARFIVAEMTEKNPNVYFEVGYAHCMNKPIIFLTKDSGDIPFDLKDRPHIIYGGDVLILKQRLEERLLSLIKQEIGWKEADHETGDNAF